MFTINEDVCGGKANGTQATFQTLVLKPGTEVQTVKLSNGIPVRAVFASEVDYIELCHTNDCVALTCMLNRLCTKAPTYWSDDEYAEMFGS